MNTNFYPRSPCGERPTNYEKVTNNRTISIHALLAESDLIDTSKDVIKANFYPRSPCGERQHQTYQLNEKQAFLSTLSLRRATQRQIEFERYSDISIHALLAESDSYSQHVTRPSGYFYPRSPCGERLTRTLLWRRQKLFLSTLSLRRATCTSICRAHLTLFLSTLSLRRATAKVHKTVGHFCAYETNFMGIASSC